MAGWNCERIVTNDRGPEPTAAQLAGGGPERAREAALGAQQAAQGAEELARKADSLADAAGQQADLVERAVDAAVQAAQQSDVLLLDEQARRLAAQVSADQPFGVPGAPMGRRSDLRRGFSLTTG